MFISYTTRCTVASDGGHDCADPNACQSSKAFAADLAAALDGHGFVALRDQERIEEGEPWREDIVDMLGDCDAAVILLSRPALDSDWVRTEATDSGSPGSSPRTA